MVNDGFVEERVDSFEFGYDFNTKLLLILLWMCIIWVSKWRSFQESVGINIESDSIKLDNFDVGHEEKVLIFKLFRKWNKFKYISKIV